MKTDLFQSCGHCWVFQICWHIECSTFTVSSFRTWNSSTGIPLPPLALFVVMLSKAHLTSHSRMSGSRSGELKRRWEEPPHVWGQGQNPGGPHARRAAAKRSYLTSEVRGSGLEYQTAMAQEGPRGDTPGPRPGGAVERRYPASEVRGGGLEELPCDWGQGPWAGGATPRTHARGQGRWPGRPTHIQGAMAVRAQEGLEELSHVEGQEGQRWGDTLRPR